MRGILVFPTWIVPIQKQHLLLSVVVFSNNWSSILFCSWSNGHVMFCKKIGVIYVYHNMETLFTSSVWYKTKFSCQNLVTNFGNHLCMVTKIGSQCLFSVSPLGWHRARCWFSCQIATNNGSPHLQIRHNLSGLYLPDWKWLHPIVIAFNTLCTVQFYIHWCVTFHWTHWGSNFEKFIYPCLGS